MPFRLPWVATGLRIDPLDFRRMARAIEDWTSRLVMDLIHDPDDATATRGAVLWGLSVSTTTVGGEPAVVVQPGVAVLGASAGENAGRLVVLQGPTTVVLTAPEAGTRNDCISIRLPGTSMSPAPSQLTTPEMRPFRRINNQGQPVQAIEEVNTEREPIGVLTVINGVASVANPAVPGDYLRLASWVVDDEGSFDDLTDLRYMVLPGAAGEAGVTNDGSRYYFRGLRKAWTWAHSAILTNATRIGLALDAVGFKASVPVSAGGPAVVFEQNGFLGHVLDLTSRSILANRHFGQFWITRAGVGSSFESPGGLETQTRHGGNFPRVQAIVRVSKTEGEVSKVEWIGEGLSDVSAVGGEDNAFDVTLSGIFTVDVGHESLNAGRWIIKACPYHDTPGSDDDSGAPSSAQVVTVAVQSDTTLRVRTFTERTGAIPADTKAMLRTPFSFCIQIFGPIKPTIGTEPQNWNVILP